jgi:hypothetical protein
MMNLENIDSVNNEKETNNVFERRKLISVSLDDNPDL